MAVSELKHTRYLHQGDQGAMLAKSVAGMAHFAGTGPEGWTCRSCTHWGVTKEERSRGDRRSFQTPKPRACQKFKQMTGKKGGEVPGLTPSCKHWEKVKADDR